MDAYWPTAGEQPNAGKHDIEHSRWYKQFQKIVISKTLKNTHLDNTKIISENIPEEINKLKQAGGKNILVFGSPSTCYTLLNEGLIDELWLFVNPVVIGEGILLFKGATEMKKLNLLESKTYPGGVIGLHYSTQQKS